MSILEDFFHHPKYTVYKTIILSELFANVRRTYSKKACIGVNTDDTAETITGLKKSIIIDQAVYNNATLNSIMDLLKEHIQCNLVQYGSEVYKQVEGIPQGSILSAMLCE